MNINFNFFLTLKKGTRGFHASAFWRDINTLIARVGKSCRTEAHKRLQNLKEKKYENCSHPIISNNKNHICTKFLLNISIL